MTRSVTTISISMTMHASTHYEFGRANLSARTCGAVLRDVAEVDPLREYRGVVIDVLEVDLDVGVTHKTFPALVLGKHGEPPLRSAIRLISVERLSDRKKKRADGHTGIL